MKNNSRGLLASSSIPKSSNKRDSLLQEFMDNEEDLVYEDFEKLSAGEQFKQIKGFHFFSSPLPFWKGYFHSKSRLG